MCESNLQVKFQVEAGVKATTWLHSYRMITIILELTEISKIKCIKHKECVHCFGLKTNNEVDVISVTVKS